VPSEPGFDYCWFPYESLVVAGTSVGPTLVPWQARPSLRAMELIFQTCIPWVCNRKVRTRLSCGTGIRGLMRGMENLPQVTRSKTKLEDPKVSLGSKSIGCDIFPSVLWHCWLGDRKGIRPVKKLGVGWLVGGDDMSGALHDLQLQ